MTKFVKGLSGRPVSNDQASGSDLGADALRNDMGHDLPASPAPTVGISAPAGDVLSPGVAPAGDITPSGYAGGGSLDGGLWALDMPEFVVQGCSCAACQAAKAGDDDAGQKGGGSPNEANPASGNIGELLTLGTNPDGSHFFTGNRNVDAVLIGSKWGVTNLTYSFPTSGSNYNGTALQSGGRELLHLDLGPQQQAAARAAFAQLQAATGLTFTEITETDTVHANIRISQTADQQTGSAQGQFPSDTVAAAGDIWFGRTNQPYYDLAYKGTWGFATMMHEIGHTMGLKHGHQDYTNSDLSFYFGTAPRSGSQSLTPDHDGQAWSLMTYTPAPGFSSDIFFGGDKISQPQSYMQYDLAALQFLYGANYNTNNGDSVYTFSRTTGEMFINGVGQGAPSGNRIFLTLWDGGGNDTIDASNYANGVTIDLRPGEFSTVDRAQLANSLANENLTVLAPGNFAMSLLANNDVRSLIENAKGGVGNDIFVGNIANNLLDGGAGSDTVVFTSVTGVNVTLNDTGADVIVTHDGETDTLRSIENIQGTIGNDNLIGNNQNNVLSGGAGGTDVLSGGDGNDRLIGGGFTTTTTVSAPSQADITKPQTTNNGSIATAVATAGFFDVDANPNITNATSVPHATINATAAGGSVEFYQIDVTVAGSRAVFDIDGTGTLDDSIIELVDSTGRVLATNDTGPGDIGTTVNDDAFISFTFATAGTFFIRVGRFTSATGSVAQPLTAGQTYQLNISLENAAVVTTTVTANNTSSLVANGGEGNDILLGTLGNDSLTGGNGNDTASFVNAFNSASNGLSTTGVTVDLNVQQGGAQNTVAAGNDILIGIENLVGSALNDTLTGDGNDNVIEGGLGDDILVGGGGNDTASYAGATAGVTASLALQGEAQSIANAGTDTLSGFENLLGSSFGDSLTGDANANLLSGGAGDDTLNPGANAGGIVDLLDGGAGTDTASFAGNAAGVTATLNGAADGAASIAGGAIATLRSIENLIGSANADILTGDGNANVIEGGLGDDTLDGGLGIDTLSFSGSTAVTVNLATLTAQDTGWGSDTITNFENVRTGSGADSVTGNDNDNILFDGGGADIYDGAAGSDTIDYSASTSTVTVNLNTTTAQNVGTFGGLDTISNIENVVGSASAGNTLTGNASANRLTGGAAADTIQGNGGADAIFGGDGNDTLLGGTTAALDDGSADTLEGGAGDDFLAGGQGNDVLRGGDGDDILAGGVGRAVDRAALAGADGGDDIYDGGDGTDRAFLVYDGRAGVGTSNVGIAFDLGNLAGNSIITFNGVSAGSLTSIETVTFRGTQVDDTMRGGGGLDNIAGNAGDDVLDGWIGNDILSGGLGSDTLIGGEGLDTVTYVNSTAGVNVDLRIVGVAQDTGGEGIDTLSGIEYLTGSNFGDTLRGNDDFNLIIDNAVSATATAFSQTDSLFGFGGNDSISVTRAAAAVATNVNMDGGDGDDLIQLISGTVTFTLDANGNSADPLGLSSGITYAAPGRSGTRFLDNVTVNAGTGDDRVVLTGVDSAVVDLGTGNDILSISTLGAAGFNDYDITTGAGQDIIWLAGSDPAVTVLNPNPPAAAATTVRANIVRDFTVGDAGDRFELRGTAAATSWVNANNFRNLGSSTADLFDSGHLRLLQSGTDILLQADRDGAAGAANDFVTIVLLAGTYTGGFTTFNFDGMIGSLTLTGQGALDETLTGASKADILSGGDGNDVLIGLDGNDTLDGGNGNDLLDGGTGADLMSGGAGDDIYVVDDAGDQIIEASDSSGGIDTVRASINFVLGTGLENLVLTGTGAINGTGNELDNDIQGNEGANYIDGGAGADIMRGGAGDDVYTVDDAADQVIEADGEGNDAVYTEVSYVLGAGQSVEVLSARDSNLTVAMSLFGNELANLLVGNNGANYLDGQAGADVMTGFGGDDVYTIDNAGDVVVEEIGGGYDTIYTSFNYVLGFGASVEVLSARDSNATDALSLFGNELDNGLIGNNGANYLDGQAGADVMTGFGGDDVYTIDNAGDVVVEEIGGGYDTIYTSFNYVLGFGASVEVLASRDNNATVALNLFGNELDNFIMGNNGVNIIDGQAGADIMVGYGGDDIYTADNAGDQVFEGAGGGNDIVYATASWALNAGQSVETLSVNDNSRTIALDLAGNELANTLLGNNGVNVLNGGDGADVLVGFGGADSFAFTTALGANNIDLVGDFTAGTDKIALDDAVFTAIGGLGTLDASAFATGTAAGDADDRIIYNNLTGQLFYDADGNGAGAAIQFATITPGLTIAATDFSVI